MIADSASESHFWDLADELIEAGAAARSTMMGLPCLRADGQFFASYDPRTSSLVVKLPAARVDDLIDSGDGQAFAPAGRRFREWAAIGSSHTRLWPSLLQEALEFAGPHGARERTRRPKRRPS